MKPTRLACISTAAAALLLFSRCPSRLLRPELWAEDGDAWIQCAYDAGLSSLAQPIAGYLQTLSRLFALLAVHLPFTAAPLLFALAAFVIQLAPAALLLSARGRTLIPNLAARLLLALFYIGEPNASEVHVNLTNAMWHLALVAFLLVVLPKPRSAGGVMAESLVLVLAGLSGPLVLFITPIAWWHAGAQRGLADHGKRMLYALLLTPCALIQGWCIVHQPAGVRVGHLGATADRLCHILSDQIFLGGMIGSHFVGMLMVRGWWLGFWPAAVCTVVALSLGIYAFLRGPDLYRQFAVLSALIVASALKSPVVSWTEPQWQPMQYPGVGGRYYVIPILGWFATLLVVAGASPRGLRWLARGLLLCCAVGVAADWHYPRYPHSSYQDSARLFDRAAPGTVVVFHENPAPLCFTLIKK